MQSVRLPATDSDPGSPIYTRLISHIPILASVLRITWPKCDNYKFRGLNTFTCVVADKLLSRGFAQFVTSLYARFCNGRVASSYPCRISRLDCTSLAWRSLKEIIGNKWNYSYSIVCFEALFENHL